jgi:hypothetical protein
MQVLFLFWVTRRRVTCGWPRIPEARLACGELEFPDDSATHALFHARCDLGNRNAAVEVIDDPLRRLA